jgi:cytochrome P450
MAMELLSFESFFFFFLLSLYVVYLRFNTSPKKPINGKGLKVYPLLGTLPEFLMNRHRFLDWTTEILTNCATNTVVFQGPGMLQGVITANSSNVEHMLKTNFENYPKGEQFIALLEDFLGRGIFNSDGELWKVQRKTASHEFNTKSLRSFVMQNVTVEINARLVPILERASETARVLDFQDILERFAFDNVCKLAFNVDPGCLGGDGTAAADFMRAFENAATLSSRRFMYAIPILRKIKR